MCTVYFYDHSHLPPTCMSDYTCCVAVCVIVLLGRYKHNMHTGMVVKIELRHNIGVHVTVPIILCEWCMVLLPWKHLYCSLYSAFDFTS